MQDRPTVDELLEAVAGFLHNDVMPNTSGRLAFHARVAGNVVEMLRRELSAEEALNAREWAGLDGLLGAEPRPDSLSETRAGLLARNQALSDRIRQGDADGGAFRTAVLAHLRNNTHDKLTISNERLAAEGAALVGNPE